MVELAQDLELVGRCDGGADLARGGASIWQASAGQSSKPWEVSTRTA